MIRLQIVDFTVVSIRMELYCFLTGSVRGQTPGIIALRYLFGWQGSLPNVYVRKRSGKANVTPSEGFISAVDVEAEKTTPGTTLDIFRCEIGFTWSSALSIGCRQQVEGKGLMPQQGADKSVMEARRDRISMASVFIGY